MISIKSQAELELIGQAGRIVSLIIEGLAKAIRIGISTYELDRMSEELFGKNDAKSAFKNYRGFPGNICVSINEELIHGIPSKKRKLKDGDLVSLDVGAKFRGFFADAAVTLPVGKVKKEAEELIKVTEESLDIGIGKARSNSRLSDISYAIQQHVESHGYSIVREFVGHGVGSQIHEEPEIPNYGLPGHGPVLKPGMVMAIEPMVNSGSRDVETSSDGWTVVTRDKRLSAHFEHTICITENEARVLTAFKLA